MADGKIFSEEYVPNAEGHTYHPKWVRANPNEAAKWTTFRDAVLAYEKGDTLSPPAMATKYGKQLVAAGKLHMSVIDLGAVWEPEPPPGPPGTVHNVPTNIDKTGNSDVTSQLSAWLNSLPAGTQSNPTIARFNGGTYTVQSIITLSNKQWLVIESGSTVLGGNTTLKHTTPVTLSGINYVGNDGHRLLLFADCSNCTVRFLTLEGASPMPSSPLPTYGMDGFKSWEQNVQHIHTLGVDRCVNMTVDRVRIWKSGGGDGINWGNQNYGTRSSGTITGCNISDCHRCAIGVVGAQDTLIIGNTFGRNGFWVIDLEPNDFDSGNYRVTIDGNTFLTNGVITPTRVSIGAFAGSKDGAGECEDLIIRNNVWSSRPVDIKISKKPYAWDGAGPEGLIPYPIRGKRLTITGNSAPVGGNSTEIRLFDTVRISGNSFAPVVDPEFNIHSCTDVQVSGSTYTQDNNI